MNEEGFNHQWRYKSDRLAWRLEEAKEHGLRWCINCGCDFADDMQITALYCSDSCRVRAFQKRRARGVRTGWMRRKPVLKGLYLDRRELKGQRADAFYLCHGITIDRAPEICRRWVQSIPHVDSENL